MLYYDVFRHAKAFALKPEALNMRKEISQRKDKIEEMLKQKGIWMKRKRNQCKGSLFKQYKDSHIAHNSVYRTPFKKDKGCSYAMLLSQENVLQ